MERTRRLEGTAGLLQRYVLANDINNVEPGLDFLNLVHIAIALGLIRTQPQGGFWACGQVWDGQQRG